MIYEDHTNCKQQIHLKPRAHKLCFSPTRRFTSESTKWEKKNCFTLPNVLHFWPEVNQRCHQLQQHAVKSDAEEPSAIRYSLKSLYNLYNVTLFMCGSRTVQTIVSPQPLPRAPGGHQGRWEIWPLQSVPGLPWGRRLKHLPRKMSGKHAWPDTNTSGGSTWCGGTLLSPSCLSELLTLSEAELSQPVEETHSGCLYLWSHSVSHGHSWGMDGCRLTYLRQAGVASDPPVSLLLHFPLTCDQYPDILELFPNPEWVIHQS